MKKIYKRIAALTAAAVMTVGLAACGGEEKIVINAYDIAVKNGFIGTEEEWLASLHGINGQNGKDMDINQVYEEAKTNGFEGSFLQFVEEYFQIDLREDNDTEMIARNICSTVSVYAAFRETKAYTVNTGLMQTEVKETIASASAGSGVIINLDKTTGDALIVTNYHVIYSPNTDTSNDISDRICVYLHGTYNGFTAAADTLNGNKLKDENGDGVANADDQGDYLGDGIKATFIGGAMEYDVALLRVSGSEYLKTSIAQAADIGSSESVVVGEKVYAIGNPNAQGISVTGGLISVKSEEISMSSMDNSNTLLNFRVMRTDAAINSGNSGGGLYDASGKLIGITNAKNVAEQTDNMGYALPIDQVKRIVDNLLAHNGVFKRAMLGVMTRTTGSHAVQTADGHLDVIDELTIVEVGESVAATGKLKVNDIIQSIKVGDKTTVVTRGYVLSEALFEVRKGNVVTVGVLRDGQEVLVDITYDQDAYFTVYD